VRRTTTAVKDRLSKEIMYWDRRAEELKAREQAGKTPRINSARARGRADELENRLQRHLRELDEERRISALPPVLTGGALIVPAGLLARLAAASPPSTPDPRLFAHETAEVERLAMEAVLAAERALGFDPRDVSAQNRGYDIESAAPGNGRLRFIEVKGRTEGADAVIVTKNEILTGLNKPDDFILAVVEVAACGDGGTARAPRYVRRPFRREPDFGASAVVYKLGELLARSETPA